MADFKPISRWGLCPVETRQQRTTDPTPSCASNDKLRGPREREVRVANSVLGVILGSAKAPTNKNGDPTETAFARVHAMHQVFCKALGEQDHSEGFALNEVHLENEYRVTSHRFRQGRRLLVRSIALRRRQAGPMKFATEAPLRRRTRATCRCLRVR